MMRQQSTDTAGAYTAQALVGFQGRGLADGAQPRVLSYQELPTSIQCGNWLRVLPIALMV